MDFVHLHVHSHFSLDDGVPSIPDLVQRARSLGMRALALTDHNTLAGIVPFCRACNDAGIHPVVGCELDVAAFDARVATYSHYRMVMLCETELGYRNLVWLVSRAHANARHGEPLLRFDDLKSHSAGLIALTGGSASELYHLLDSERLQEAEALVTELVRIFGRRNVVFELQDHNLPKQRHINERLYGLADFLSMRAVATNDVHYLRPEDAICHDFLKRERPPTFLDLTAARNATHGRHLAGCDEMRARFAKFSKAYHATCEVAERCGFQPNFDRRRFPVQDFVRGFDADSYLWDETFKEARKRYVELSTEIKDRLNMEFDHIKSEGLSNNILLLWNLVTFCRKNRIHMGVGRGNMISSLVAFVLGITQINPLDYKLRFLGFDDDHVDHRGRNRNRCLTLEVSDAHSDRLMEFMRHSFGPDSCSAVGRYVTSPRHMVISDICSWFNHTLQDPDAVLDLPRDGHGRLPDIESFFPRRKEGVSLPNPGIISFMLSRLLPRPKSLGVADNQFALSGENLNNLVPRVDVEDETVTQMDAAALDMLNIPRLMIQSNRLLDIIDTASLWVRKEENANFDPDNITLNDGETYDLLSRGLTNGILPFQSITLKSLLRMHRPRNFMQLVKIKSMERTPAREQESSDVLEHVPECLLTFRCAFIKAHYPLSFMTALLTHSYRTWKRYTLAMREAKQMGLRILPPDINQSLFEFSQVHKAIRTGLMVVNGMGRKVYAELERVRKGGDFHDLVDLCRRTDGRLINARVLSNLVKAGALDSFGLNRAQMLAVIDEGLEVARDPGGQATLFDQPGDRGLMPMVEPPDIPEMSAEQMVKYEIAVTGNCISQDLLALYSDLVRQCRALAPHELTARMVGREVYVAGFLDDVETASPLVEDSEQVLLDLEGHVVSMPRKAANLYAQATTAQAPVLVGGTVARRKDEVYVKALTAFTLRMVQEMSQQVLQIDLDLTDEDFRTLHLIRQQVRHYRGGLTRIRISNAPSGMLARWTVAAVHRTPVFFSPPFYYALKKILPEERIGLTAAEETDPELLHALSPLRFPRPDGRGGKPAMVDEASVVDDY